MQLNLHTGRNSSWRATRIAGTCASSLLRRRGLTLIELTMVLLIMGILTAVAAPRLTSQLNQHSVGSVRTLILTDLKAAQQEALTTSSSVNISIDRLRNLYQVTANRGGTATILKTVRIGDDPWNSAITSLLQGSTKKSVDTMTLTINGAGVFAENLVINLASGSATARATVDAATGRILVE
ncbi:MAG: prepilin-type N-terminal cleavage/methylation domain-containing protein [Planctomycetaceae bacterium]